MNMESFENVWEALESDPAEVASLTTRSELMIALRTVIEGWELGQDAAARRLGVEPKRLADLFQGEIDEFSIDDLVKLAGQAGMRVKFNLTRRAA